jgi:hypothetical membrane protein
MEDRDLSVIAGAALIVVFCAFTLASIVLFPGPFSPVENWLSDLGNTKMNPQGNWFFNIGCILTGLLLYPFFKGLDAWKSVNNGRLLSAGRLSGAVSALSLVMIGIFCEDYDFYHLFWSGAFFISLLFTMAALTLSMFGNGRFIRPIGYYGVIVIAIDVVFIAIKVLSLMQGSTLPMNELFEWFTVFTGLAWAGLVVINMRTKLPACACKIQVKV